MEGNLKHVEQMLDLGADPNQVFHGFNHTGKTGEWFTPLDLLVYIMHDTPLFENGFPEHYEELPELHEKYANMLIRLRFHGAQSYETLFPDHEEL